MLFKSYQQRTCLALFPINLLFKRICSCIRNYSRPTSCAFEDVALDVLPTFHHHHPEIYVKFTLTKGL